MILTVNWCLTAFTGKEGKACVSDFRHRTMHGLMDGLAGHGNDFRSGREGGFLLTASATAPGAVM